MKCPYRIIKCSKKHGFFSLSEYDEEIVEIFAECYEKDCPAWASYNGGICKRLVDENTLRFSLKKQGRR